GKLRYAVDPRRQPLGRREVAANGVGVRKGDRTVGVPPIDAREQTTQERVAVLATERQVPALEPDEPEHLVEVIGVVRHGDETAAWAEYARDLAEGTREIRNVVEHPRRDHDVEARSLERERLHVADSGVEPPTPGHLDHARRLVDR